MNLCLDVGNTRIKWALFKGLTIIDHGYISHSALLAHVQSLESHYQRFKVIISDVSGNQSIKQLAIDENWYVFEAVEQAPLSISYNTPDTLGLDRVAACLGAHLAYPAKDILVIDAGTCITYDIITQDGTYRGGAISPGLNMRAKAMHSFTGKLPLIETDGEIPSIGKSTSSSMLLGAKGGMVVEVDGFIRSFETQYPNLICVITGGDHSFLVKALKSNIFADPFLLVKGLNEILNNV